MNCSNCGITIPEERIEALPDTTTCVNCSEVKRKIGVMIWDDKTPELLTLDEEDANRHWDLEKMDGRLGRLK